MGKSESDRPSCVHRKGRAAPFGAITGSFHAHMPHSIRLIYISLFFTPPVIRSRQNLNPRSSCICSFFASFFFIYRYDFAVYGLLAPEIGAAFFPQSSKELQLVNSFGVYLAAFIMRPIGAILFGK